MRSHLHADEVMTEECFTPSTVMQTFIYRAHIFSGFTPSVGGEIKVKRDQNKPFAGFIFSTA